MFSIRKLMLLAVAIALSLSFSAQTVRSQGQDITKMSWDEIVAAAKGGTVNWYMWGGSDLINKYVSDWVGSQVKDKYGITLNRVGINDTVDAVNKVLGEQQAGNNDKGSVDLIWINGENFKTMKQGKLVFCGYTDKLPNMKLVNTDDPAIANDFGEPVEGCEVPWNRAQVAMIYNSDTVKEPPKNMAAFLDWVKANPGRFTYPAPPDFTGSVFVRHVFYYASGDYKKLLGPFNQQVYDQVAPKTWQILNDIKPSLWRKGETYPKDRPALDQLFANGEVDYDITYDPTEVGALIDKGTFPKSAKTFVFQDGTIGNVNYVAIPYNSPNKAAAVVVANFLLSPDAQYAKAQPDVWGTTSVLDSTKLDKDWQDKFSKIPRNPAVVSVEELAKHSLPELQSKWLTTIEDGWKKNVASK